MTPDERINAAWANLFVGCEPSVELRQLWRDTISAAVEEVEDRVANERDSHVERIAELEAALAVFEDGANWEVFPGMRDLPIYEWRHDSDPRVLAQDARSTAKE